MPTAGSSADYLDSLAAAAKAAFETSTSWASTSEDTSVVAVAAGRGNSPGPGPVSGGWDPTSEGRARIPSPGTWGIACDRREFRAAIVHPGQQVGQSNFSLCRPVKEELAAGP